MEGEKKKRNRKKGWVRALNPERQILTNIATDVVCDVVHAVQSQNHLFQLFYIFSVKIKKRQQKDTKMSTKHKKIYLHLGVLLNVG